MFLDQVSGVLVGGGCEFVYEVIEDEVRYAWLEGAAERLSQLVAGHG